MKRFFVYFAKVESQSGLALAAVHWCGKCYTCRDVEIRVPCRTRMRKRSPKMVMTGKALRFHMLPDNTGILE